MRGLGFIAFFLCIALSSQAQIIIVPREKLDEVRNPRLSQKAEFFAFEKTVISADVISEDDGVQTFAFPFDNVGKETLHIQRIVTTCACAVASCPQMIIPPGESSQIEVRYNPKGHPGRFERRIMIYVADEESPAAVLRLNVDVERGKDKSGLYPISMGAIRVRRNQVHFDKGCKAVESCVFMNVSDKPLNLDCERALLPACLSFRTEPAIVASGEEGRIVIAYDPTKGGERERVPVMIKALGLPPSQSAITVIIKEK
jgi:hypothetical protein